MPNERIVMDDYLAGWQIAKSQCDRVRDRVLYAQQAQRLLYVKAVLIYCFIRK